MTIITQHFFTAEQIAKVEQKYNAKYICDSSVKWKDQWRNIPVGIFYQEEAHPDGSNYFGLFWGSMGELSILDAISATEPFQGLQLENGDVIYSRYRHDFFEHNGVFVDGGREYFRCGGDGLSKTKTVTLQIVKDKLEIVNE